MQSYTCLLAGSGIRVGPGEWIKEVTRCSLLVLPGVCVSSGGAPLQRRCSPPSRPPARSPRQMEHPHRFSTTAGAAGRPDSLENVDLLPFTPRTDKANGCFLGGTRPPDMPPRGSPGHAGRCALTRSQCGLSPFSRQVKGLQGSQRRARQPAAAAPHPALPWQGARRSGGGEVTAPLRGCAARSARSGRARTLQPPPRRLSAPLLRIARAARTFSRLSAARGAAGGEGERRSGARPRWG